MISTILVFLNTFTAVATAQQNTTITVVLEKSETIEAVQADVVIQAGQLISSNCEQLGQQEGMPAFKLQLNSVSGQYLCVPERDSKVISQKMTVDMGIELTVENIKNEINKITSEINQHEGYTPSQPKAQCSLDASGNVNVNSCKCESEKNLYSFDIASKSCKLINSDIMSFYVADCSEQMRDTLSFLQRTGARMKSPYDGGIEFAMCVDWRSEDYFIPGSDLVYKVFYFLYGKHMIAKELSQTNEFENIKILVSQAEIESLKQWSITYAQEFSSSPTAQLVMENAENDVPWLINQLPDVFMNIDDYQDMTDLIVIEETSETP